MRLSYSHGREFVEQIEPVLGANDSEALKRFLSCWWPNEKLLGLLGCGHQEAARVAVFCLALTGTVKDTPAVARLLHDDDIFTTTFAERTLWSIWFRAGDDQSNNQLMRAIQMISEDQLEPAVGLLTTVVVHCPTFAEAYNQRAIALFLLGRYEQAAEDCRRTLRLNPCHFTAMAGLGHCHASQGRWEQALEAYHRTLQLHPRAEGIRQSIRQVQETVRSLSAAGGKQPFPAA